MQKMGNDATVLISHSEMILAFRLQLRVVARSLDEILRQKRVLKEGEVIAIEELESSTQELNWYLLALRKRINRVKKEGKDEF